jgi:hypothetical protein
MKRLYHRKEKLFAVIGIALFGLAGCANAQPDKSTFTPDAHTVMLLQPGANGTMTDAKSTFIPTIKGATTIDDPEFGKVLEFGDAKGNGISVPDDGKLDFSKAITLEMMIYLQQPDAKTPNTGGGAFVKMGSFYTAIKKNKFDVTWLSLPSVPVATSTDKQYKSYPVGGTGFPGRVNIPANQWVHLTFSYNPALRVARVWINDEPDQGYYLPDRDIPGKAPGVLRLENNPGATLTFASGMKNVRVGEIRVSNIARAITPLVPFESYFMALPYREKPAVIIDHIDAERLPLNVTIKSGDKELKKLTLTDTTRKVLFYDPPAAKDKYSLTVAATSQGKQVYLRQKDVYAGDDRNDPVHFDTNNRFIVNGKPIFPIIIYHTFKEDIPELAKLGFTAFTGARYPNSALLGLPTRTPENIAMTREYLDVAKANNMFMAMGGGVFAAGIGTTLNELGIKALDKDPGVLFWYGADEPGGKRIEELRDAYVTTKQWETRPVLMLTNRSDHIPRIAEAGDFVGVDPYPLPNISLRAVADMTRQAVQATDGLKPVFTAIPQYSWQLPTLPELRCMAYLAIGSGANALGIYAWDDRNSKTLKGWYTKEHPEDLKVLSDFMSEMKQLKDTVLIAPNLKREMTFTPQNLALHATLKGDDKDTYLLLVNDSRAAQESTLSIDGLQSADGADVFGSADKITIRDGKLHVQLPPLGVELYKLSNVK